MTNATMDLYFDLICFTLIIKAIVVDASICGCKTVRPCYMDMVETLKYHDEASCIEDAAIGTSTIMIFLKAIKQFCPEIITVHNDEMTYEERRLYEVVLSKRNDSNRPVILIEAGQQGGQEAAGFALYIIEQLIACEEYDEMLEKARWVILPATNPDGMEFAKFDYAHWKKNCKPSPDNLSVGVDITRNFPSQWGACEKIDSGFSEQFPGLAAATENETIFVKNIFTKYKNDIKTYLSIRRDGHSIGYPHAYRNNPPDNPQIAKIAGDIAAKVNQRAGSFQQFVNGSIYDINGRPHCGHSVDFAYDQGVPLAYEMRVFLGTDNKIMSMFQKLPRGYEASLRAGYFSGIKELYNSICNEKKYGKVF